MALVRYFAGARAAAGVSEETVSATTLDELVSTVSSRSDRMANVLSVSSFLVDGLACHDRTMMLPGSCTVDILPPFAGG